MLVDGFLCYCQSEIGPCQLTGCYKLLEVVGTRLAAGVDESEEPRCYLSQEMKPYLSSCAQVMINGFNVLE